jgi:Domain of unknown function (DUF6457)
MNDWIDRLAEALGVDAPNRKETERLLGASREVAHRVERRITPLSTFVVGLGVAARIAAGASREAAFAETLGVLDESLPPRVD